MKNLNKILILLISLFLFSCVSKVSSQTHTFAFLLKFLLGDKTAPTISFTSPASIDDEFETNKSFAIVFSESVSGSTNSPLKLSLNGVDTEGSAEFLDNTLIFTPSSPLVANTKYLVNISGVQDKSGNSMVDVYQYSFKTGNGVDTTPLSINATSPVSDASNVELNAKIAIEFNETLNPKSVLPTNFILKANGVNVEYSFEYLGNILYVKPLQDLSAYTYYTLTIRGEVTDTSNLPLGSDYSINFLTANAKDATPPAVTQSYPEETVSPALRSRLGGNILFSTIMGTEIQPAQMVMIDFSEGIINTFPDTNIFVTKADTGEKVNFGVRRGLSSITVFPISDNSKWELGEKYKLTILTSVTDLATNALSNENYELVFPVASVEILPIVPPEVSLQVPYNTETDVNLKSKIRMTFSKPLFKASANIDSIYLEDNLGNKVTGTFSFVDKFTVAFMPTGYLSPNTTYTGHVKTIVRGLENTKLASDYTYTFTTESLFAPTSLSYSKEYYLFNAYEAITPMIPTYGGHVTSCSISPSLPTGLSILSNCTIHGKTEISLPITEFTITASNASGSTNTKVLLNIIKNGEDPFFFNYSSTNHSFIRNTSISAINPTKVGLILACSSTPTLPTGLILASDCRISGIPTTLSPLTTYSITGSAGASSLTRNISISIIENTLSYPSFTYALIANASITITPTVDATTYSCSIAPALPSGLSIDSKDCKISGAPLTSQSDANYLVTAMNNGGSATANLTISIRQVNSCKEILDNGLSVGSGVYQIDADGLGGQAAFRVYCDMTTDGGGWTLGLLKNSKQNGNFSAIASNYTNLSHLEYSPEIASQVNINLEGWLNGNTFSYTNLRVAAYHNGTQKFLSADIPKTSLRLSFGQSGYFLYGSPSGYYWCGGIRNFTDFGTYEDNPVSGTSTTRKCKIHTGLGSGFDFSTSNLSNNQGLTLHASDGAGSTMLVNAAIVTDGSGTGSTTSYTTVGAAFAFWFR